MTFIFDKSLETEKHIEMDYYSEQVKNHKLNATKEYKIYSEEDFPDISDFGDGMLFTTLEVKDGLMTVPIIGQYNSIDTFNASYSSVGKTYIINMILGVKPQ